MKGILLFILLISCCNKSERAFDKIHLITDTDSSLIRLIISNDSTLVLQLERGDCDPYYGCSYGPKYYAEVAKHEQLFPSINKKIQSILSDTFHLERIVITHGNTSQILFLFQDSIIKCFNYYGSETNCSDLLSISQQILNKISQANRNKLNITERLLDVSGLKFIDSIRISKLKPAKFKSGRGTNIKFINDYVVKRITSKVQIDSLINCIQNMIILDTSGRKACEEFIPEYKFDFFRNGLIRFQLKTDLKIIPFSWPQTLKADSCIIRLIL